MKTKTNTAIGDAVCFVLRGTRNDAVEGGLAEHYFATALQSFLAFLLFLEQLFLSRLVTATNHFARFNQHLNKPEERVSTMLLPPFQLQNTYLHLFGKPGCVCSQ